MKNKILEKIQNSNKILIITHVNPDGDTLGSASALKTFIGDKADILIQIEDNFNFPKTYSFLPHISTAKNLSTLEDIYELIIAVDVASEDRIIENAKTIFDNRKNNTISFDHHKTNTNYASINWVKGGISSTGEVLYDFFQENNIKITQEMAIGLYSAILTDTGCFKYESTTPHTFEIATNLSKTGINTSQIADLCYTNKAKNLILFQSEIISNGKFCLNDKIAYAQITQDFIKKYNAKDEYTEGICEILRSISNVEIAYVLKETKNNNTKVSIRTKEIDATKIAKYFNGGGHKRAAGCTIKMGIAQATEKLIAITKELL